MKVIKSSNYSVILDHLFFDYIGIINTLLGDFDILINLFEEKSLTGKSDIISLESLIVFLR